MQPQKGRVLIAEPFLSGDYFNRSIILLTDYNKTETVGFVLNKPIDFPVEGFRDEFPGLKTTLSFGGPVNTDTLFYVHTLGDKLEGSVHVSENLYWGGDYEQLKYLLNSRIEDASSVRFFLGYSGWSHSQLQEELAENSWLVSDISSTMVMKSEDKLWMRMVEKLGGRYQMWVNFPENPLLN